LAVVARALVDVLDQQADRRSCGDLSAARFVLEHAGEDAHRVRFAALAGVARPAGPALVHPVLDVGLDERDQRRAAVDHTADGGSVRFAEGGDPEEMAESVVRHDAGRLPNPF